MARDWNIKPRGSRCAGCGGPFAPGGGCVSAIFREDGGFVRRDYCPACWGRGAAPPGPFSSWQGTYEPPPAGNKKDGGPAGRGTAESLLRRLVARDDPADADVVYILAVMLERKKLLVERDSRPREEGGVFRFYEHKASGETFVVLDPQLRLDEIDGVQRRVVELLEG